jgi:uridine kinase
MEESLTKVAQKIKTNLKKDEVFLVSIDGRGGSGKSTLTTLLAQTLEQAGETVAVIATDSFVLNKKSEDWMPLKSRPDVKTPFRIAIESLKEVLKALRTGTPAHYTHRDWWNPDHTEEKSIESKGVVLVEGIYALSSTLRNFYDFKIFVDSPLEIAMKRAIERDFANGGNEETAPLLWEEVYAPLESEYLEEENPQAIADLVVDGAKPIHTESVTYKS